MIIPVMAIIGVITKINHRIPKLVNNSLKNLLSRKKLRNNINNPIIDNMADLRTEPVPFIATIPYENKTIIKYTGIRIMLIKRSVS